MQIDRPGLFGHAAGVGTDDSETTRAVADAYLAGGEITGAVRTRLIGWLAGGPLDVGATTAAALRRARTGQVVSGDLVSEANGSLMRTSPVGLVHQPGPELLRNAADVSAITHASPVCVDACQTYSTVLSGLINNPDPRLALARANPGTAAIRAALVTARQTARIEGVPCAGIGHVVYAFTLAVWALSWCETFEDALEQVVDAGGDSDTNAAIVGGLLGARWGYTAIPQRWLDRLAAHDELVAVADRLFARRCPNTALVGRLNGL